MLKKTAISLLKGVPIVILLLIRQQYGFCSIPDPVIVNPVAAYISSPGDTAKVNFYVIQGNLFLKDVTKPGVVDLYIDSALSVCTKKNMEIPPSLHLLIAEQSYNTGDFTKSEEEANLAARNSESREDYKLLARTLQFQGKYYLRTGFFKESSDAYMRSIEIAKREKIKGFIPLGYIGEASVLYAAGDIKGFRHNLGLMIAASFAENDLIRAESGLLELGNSYSNGKEFDKADSVLRQCIAVSLKTKDTYYTGFSSANIGWGFYSKKMYDSALYYYKQSLNYSVPKNFYGISANSLGNIGTIYRDLGNKTKAVSFYEKSIEQAKVNNDWYTLSWVYNDMSLLYLGSHDTARAYISYVKFKQYNDSLQTTKNTKGLADARIRYEADMHKKEISLLSLRLKNNRILNIAFTGLILLIAVIAFLLVRGARNEEKRRLSELNRQIAELTQANLRQQMNPHFIFNTLNSIQYYMFQHDKLATNEYLTKFSSLMRKVLENSQHTEVSLRDELDALNLYLELESLRFKDKFEYNINIDDEIDPLLYKVPTMLIQPYVENSICHGLKHADGKGTVSIDIRLGRKQLICTIEDNGIGREAARQKVEAEGGNHNSLGTRITGSRLNLVNSLYGTTLKTVYTDLKNEDGTPGGTRVEIQIPIIT